MTTIKVNPCINIFYALQALEENFGGVWEEVKIGKSKYVFSCNSSDSSIKVNTLYIFKWSHFNTIFLGGTLKESKKNKII